MKLRISACFELCRFSKHFEGANAKKKNECDAAHASNLPKHDGSRHHHASGKICRNRRYFNAFMDCHCPRLGSSGLRFRPMRHAVEKIGRTGRLCRICLWRTRRFYRQLCLCHFTRLRQHCHLSGSRKLWSELVPSAVFIRFCLRRLRAPFMDRITSHLPLPVHHRPHHRHLRLGALAAFDYACRCGRLLV